MNLRTPEVLCIGETMVLVHPEQSVPLELADSVRLGLGGAESNVALYLGRLGHATEWFSRIGDDPLGRRLVSELARHGVGVSRVRVDKQAPTGVYFKDPSPAGTRVHYYRAGSAASRMEVPDIADLDITGIRVIHISGITPGLSEGCARMIDRIIDDAHEAGARISFDVNYRPGIWNRAEAAGILAELAGRCDLVFVGRDEAEILWNTVTASAVAERLKISGTLVVKDGAVGATEFTAESEVFVPAPTVDVVEPVGAGDAFAAGYISAALRGKAAEARLREGHRLAAQALGSTSDFDPREHCEQNPLNASEVKA